MPRPVPACPVGRGGELHSEISPQKQICLPAPVTTAGEAGREVLERKLFSVPRTAGARQKACVSNKLPWPKAGRFMENRYLPILHENIYLSVLSASNESRLTGRMGGEKDLNRLAQCGQSKARFILRDEL